MANPSEDFRKNQETGIERTIADYEINSEGYVIEAGTEGTTDEKAILLDADNDGKGDKVIIADGNHNFNLKI